MKIIKTYDAIAYVADDGIPFDTQEEALKHEEKLKEKVFCLELSENHWYRVDVKAKSGEEAIELFYADPDSYTKYDHDIETQYISANEKADR